MLIGCLIMDCDVVCFCVGFGVGVSVPGAALFSLAFDGGLFELKDG